MDREFEEHVLEEANYKTPIPGILRILNSDVYAVRAGGADLNPGLEADDIIQASESRDLINEVRSCLDDFNRVKKRERKIASMGLETVRVVSLIDQFGFSVNPDERISVALLATTPRKKQELKERVKGLEDLSVKIAEQGTVERMKEYHYKRGRIFGYPDCDLDFFNQAFEEEKDKRPERSSVESFMDQRVWTRMINEEMQGKEFSEFLENPPEEFYSLTSMSFYPHKPDCRDAIDLSLRTIDNIGTAEAELLYRFEIFFNHIQILKGQFGNRREDREVSNMFGRISSSQQGREVVELLRKITGNHFISNYNLLYEKYMRELL